MLRTFALALSLVLLFAGCSGSELAADAESLSVQAALAELDALRTPEDANPQQFAELKQSLRAAIQKGGLLKFAAAAPEAAAGAVTDLTLTIGASGAMLEWTYRNKGDYDQNKQVTISDLSTLGSNLGKTPVSPDWLSKAVAADGDANGEVNVSDITPIGANLLATVSGYKIQTTDTPGVAASWHDFDEATFETSAISGGSALRRFTHNFAPSPNSWYRVVPFDGNSLGVPSNEVQYALSAPDITAVTPVSGDAGTVVTVFPTNAGGTVQTWTWDFGGGATPNNPTNAQPAITLGSGGVYNASVTVSNPAGSDTFDFTLTVINPPAPVIEDVQPQGGSEGEAVSFTAAVSGGPVATYAWDFGGGATPNTDSAISPFVTLGSAGIYSASLTVSNAGGTDIYNFNLSVTPGLNNPPTASFTATPQNGDPGEAVALDASASSDSDGSIVKYEWDLDGDGAYEVDNGASPLANTTLPNPEGTVDVGLRVTDNWNVVDTEMMTLSSSNMSGTWLTITIDGLEEDCGEWTSLEEVNGGPAICYNAFNLPGANELRYAYSADPLGEDSWNIVTIDDTDCGDQNSLAIINGKPAISYRHIGGNSLSYAYSSSADGNSGWSIVQIDDSGGWLNPFGTSLSDINGKPAISYLKRIDPVGDATLKYAYSNTADGSSGWNTTTVDDAIGCEGTSLALINGKPAIGYYTTTTDFVRYAWSTSADGSSGWNSIDIEGTGGGFRFSSLAAVNGFPALAFHGFGDQRFAWSDQLDGSSGWKSLSVDSGANGSLAVIAGKPAIAYDSTKFAWSNTADGGSSWSTMPGPGAGSLAEINGRPAVSFYDSDNRDLKYAVLLP